MLDQVDNSTCSVCRQVSPALYCTCQGVKSFLCNSCISVHTLKFPQYPHPMAPVAVDNVDFSAFELRTKRLAEWKVELQRNLGAIDSCCYELSAAVDTLTEQLAQLRDQWLQHLYQWKSQLKQEFDEAIEEVGNTILEETPVFTAKYSQALRTYQIGELFVFSYQIDVSGVQASFESFVKTNFSDAGGLQFPLGQEQQRGEELQSSSVSGPYYAQEVQFEPRQSQEYCPNYYIPAQPNPSYEYYMVSRTVQPSPLRTGLPTPASAQPIAPYHYGQYSAPRQPQFFQVPSTCPTCSQPFLNEGGKHVYCSADCNPNKHSSVPAAGNYKECASCKGRFLFRQFPIPPDWQEYGNLASSVCSPSCLRNFIEVVTGQQICAGCGQKSHTQSFVLQLQCGHGFHSNDCLFNYLVEATRAFTYSTKLSCNRCHQQFRFDLVFQAMTGEEFAYRQGIMMKQVCSTCGSYNVQLQKQCMHRACNEHPRHRCYFCNPIKYSS